VQIWNSWVINS